MGTLFLLLIFFGLLGAIQIDDAVDDAQDAFDDVVNDVDGLEQNQDGGISL